MGVGNKEESKITQIEKSTGRTGLGKEQNFGSGYIRFQV